MDESTRILRPEQKHGEADAQRRSDDNITNFALYKTLVQEINNSSGCVDTAPLTLYGVLTREYCIVPCPFIDNEPRVVQVIQYMRGQGWVADLFRMSESLENPSKYRQAILVCWDPKVISACYAPRYYTAKNTDRTPCGLCSKHDTGGVSGCEGCATLRLWLAGNTCMKSSGEPCARCSRSGNRKKESACTECPASLLYRRLYGPKEEEAAVTDKSTEDGDSTTTTVGGIVETNPTETHSQASTAGQAE